MYFRHGFNLIAETGVSIQRARPLRHLGRDQPAPPQWRGGRERVCSPRDGPRMPPLALRDARRHRSGVVGRQRHRRRRGRWMVAGIPLVADEAGRLRGLSWSAGSARGHCSPTGHSETIATDLEWRTSVGPILGRGPLQRRGPTDARLDLDGWSGPGFDDSGWSRTALFSPTVGELVAPTSPPVRRVEELDVEDVIVTPSGRTIGLWTEPRRLGEVRGEGAPGTIVTLRHAEVLEDGELGVRPLRNAKATDVYTLRGQGTETWEPTFTFHGFRYVGGGGLARDVRAGSLQGDRDPFRPGADRHLYLLQRRS